MAHTNSLSLGEREAEGSGVILSYIVKFVASLDPARPSPSLTPKIKDILGSQKENGHWLLVPLCFQFTNIHQF